VKEISSRLVFDEAGMNNSNFPETSVTVPVVEFNKETLQNATGSLVSASFTTPVFERDCAKPLIEQYKRKKNKDAPFTIEKDLSGK